MKAAVYTRYGPPDVVHITDVEKPSPKDNEVLIKVRAASVNPLDWHFMRGTPYFVRIEAGPRKPKVTRLGVDVAGQVEAVGRNATNSNQATRCSAPAVGSLFRPGSALGLATASRPSAAGRLWVRVAAARAIHHAKRA